MNRNAQWRYWGLILFGYASGAAVLFRSLHYVSPGIGVLAAFLLPSAAAVMYLSVTTILAKDPMNGDEKGLAVTYDRILFGVVLFTIALHGLVIATIAGVLPTGPWLARAPIVLFGLLGMWVGNLLPRTRPNLALGIRTRRTLWNRDAWMRTHRIAGHVAVFLGGLFVVAGAFFSKQRLETVLGPVSMAAAALLIAQHLGGPKKVEGRK